ncbi:Uncharacterised protein [Moraxella lacunata]|uniref:Uncharacterized protein n=1 Tax=Moraxella lacunata TaxID=477 RepID=A0A378TSZ1_MORLA|nr:hypothetical protein [Moraxella lacunata]STZ63050.1 Uncharacterised protein [Moraxella lacunata]
MLNRNFLRKIKIDNILKYLELATKLVAIIIIVATIIGGLNIYSYLKDINHLFLFSDVVGISYASVSALISYFLFVFVVSLGFLSPFIIPVFLLIISNDGNKNNNTTNKTTNRNPKSLFNPSERLLKFITNIKSLLQFGILCISPICLIAIPLLPIMLIIFIVCSFPFYVINFIIKEFFFGKERILSFNLLSKFIHWISFLCTISITIIVFFGNDFLKILLYGIIIFFIVISFLYTRLFIKNIYDNNVLISEKLLLIIVLSFMSISPSLLHFLFVVYPTVNIIKYEIAVILFYIFSIFLFGLSCLLSHITIYDYFQEKKFDYTKKYNMKLIVVNFIPVFIYVLYLSYFSSYNMSLYSLRFIEKPQDSSWYLIHNGNTNSNTINGLTQTDITKAKEIFNAQNCDGLTDKVQENCKNDNKQIFNQRQNALYGYMAWNLGNTKVFCPVSVDFFKFTADEESRINQSKDIAKTKTQQEKSAKCLVIDGKYLQPVSEHYLGQMMLCEKIHKNT